MPYKRNNTIALDVIRWEIEEYLSLPIVAFVVGNAIISVLAQTTTNVNPSRMYLNLFYGSAPVLLFLTITTSVLFCRSYGGSIGKGETKLMLSYPIKRQTLFLLKYAMLFVTVMGVYGAAYFLHVYLDGLSVFDPMVYISLFSLFLQLILVSAFSTGVSIATKNEVISILVSVLVLLGLENIAGSQGYFSGEGRFANLFQYFGSLSHTPPPLGPNFIVSETDVSTCIAIPIVFFLILFTMSFLYFTRFMEFD